MRSLRERRKHETAREIQRVTLALAQAQGLATVTVEAIARAAGISPRSFFNYYPNKESAVFGVPPDLTEAQAQRFREGTGPLSRDLRALLSDHLGTLERDRANVYAISMLEGQSERLTEMHRAFGMRLRGRLRALIAERLPEESADQAAMLADMLLAVARIALDFWLETRDARIGPSLDRAWASWEGAAARLAPPFD